MTSPSQSSIQSMSFRELRKECTKNGLSAGGNSSALRKRLFRWLRENKPDADSNSSLAEEVASSKRRKRSIEDDLLCPITWELPIDPVTAEDGRVYERHAIEMHFESRNGEQVKSPMTNLAMGQLLLPAPHTKNIIETCIENGTIGGEVASRWKDRMEEKKKRDALIARAERGDVRAMEGVGSNHVTGKHGFSKNSRQAYLWFDRAFRAGSVWGMAQKGHMMALGLGVSANARKGVLHVTAAEARGSDWAAYCLGMDYYGLQLTNEEAAYFLNHCLRDDCTHRNLPEECKIKAQEKLNSFRNQES